MAKRQTQTKDGKTLRELGRKWLNRIEEAGTTEETWLRDAEFATRVYTATGGQVAEVEAAWLNSTYDFNILYSNVETIVPAVINSPPIPDIRRRFGDTDPVAHTLAEILDRSIRVQVDDGRLQTEMEATAQDGFLAGRGVLRLRFEADIDESNEQLEELAEDAAEAEGAVVRDDGQTVGSDGTGDSGGDDEVSDGYAPGGVSNERITFEAVSWRDYRHGPAKRWADRPWEAFRHALPVEDVSVFSDSALTSIQTLPEDKRVSGDPPNDVIVWEVWDKKTKQVLFISQNNGIILKRVDDPLGLYCFFSTATPIQPVEINGRLMPVNPFAVYRKLADELDVTTRRIIAITDQMRVRGWYPGDAADIKNMLDGGDNDWQPITNPELWAQNGGLEKAVAFWPIDRFIQALQELYAVREQTKQAIYEITGISDIVRGASKTSETATAQQIKTQWGSLRIQKFQRMLERAARDLFVMMAEIIPKKFGNKTLEQMTGIQIEPTQQDLTPLPMPPPSGNPQQDQQAQQQWQQAEQARQKKLNDLTALKELMKNPTQAYYRIDVETDSTVRADLTRQKAEVAEFVSASGNFFQGAVPMVESGVFTKADAMEIYGSFSRLFNLGKTVEDTIDKSIERSKQESGQPKPPSPEQIKAQADAKASEAQSQADMQRAQAETASAQAEQIRAQTEAQDAQLTNAERAQALQNKTANDAFELDKKRQTATIELSGKQAAMDQSAQKHQQDMEIGRLQIVKLNKEIEGVQVKTVAAAATAEHNAALGERAQTLKESQAKEPAK